MGISFKLYAGGYEGKVHVLEFTPAQEGHPAKLEQKSESTLMGHAGDAPTWLTMSSNRKYLYATDEWGDPEGKLTSFSIDPESRALKSLSSVRTKGLWPCHSTLLEQTTPQKLVTVNYKGRAIISHSIRNGDFVDGEEPQVISLEEQGVPGPHSWRQTQQHPHEVHADPKGEFIVIPDLGTDDLRVYLISKDGQLTHHQDLKLAPGSGPRHVLFSTKNPSSPTLYVLNELSNSISVLRLSYTSSGPTFELVQDTISTLPSSTTGMQSSFDHWHAAEIKLHPSGKFLYASNRAEDHDPLKGTAEGEADSIAIFPVDLETGRLDAKGRTLISSGGRAPRHFAFSSESKMGGSGDGKLWVAVAAHDSNDVIISEVVESDGTWNEVAQLKDVGRPGIVLWV